MANGTFTPYRRPQFEPETTAITINCLFFASLSASLVAALASVVALQWVANYDATITRGGSSPEDRAERRQFRYAGVAWWKMSEIIAALPLLVYGSVVLFFSGLTLWMWTIHHTVGAVVAGGMGIAVLFYGATTLISVASVSAPFRTPLSRLIYSSVHLFFSTVDLLSRFLPIPSSREWLKERHQRYTGALKWDNDEVGRRHWLGADALSWLASHLSISMDSYDRLLLLVNELRKQDQKYFITPRFHEAPWFSIFGLLAWRNLKTAGPDDDISKGEMRAVAILAHCYRIPAIYAIIRPKEEMLYCSDDSWLPLSPSTSLNSLFLLLRDIPLPSKDTAKQIEFTIRLSRWRNSTKRVQGPSKDEGRHENTPPASSSASVVVVDRFLKVDEENVWFTRDDRSLYEATVGRMVRLYVETGEKMAPHLLDTLRWRFESLLLGKEGYAMDAILCLSRPLLYHKAFKKHETEYSSLHGDFTLLLARNLKSFSGTKRARRVKEIITMMWLSPGRHSDYITIHERQGMESFFDTNRNIITRWVHNSGNIPHSLEILEHLSLAQAEQPDIGSLWRAVNAQPTFSNLFPALRAFDRVIDKGVTPEQHLVLIDLVCRDIELCPSDAFRANVDSFVLQLSNELQDPCLRFIGTAVAGAEVEFAEDTSLLKASWARIANHLIGHYEGTDSPSVLKLQASVWFLVPSYVAELCLRALREPQALAHLRRIFEYPVQCPWKGHDSGERHLLRHILWQFGRFKFPVNIPALTEFPMKDQYLRPTLAVLILLDGYEELLREEMHKQEIDESCTDQVLEMISTISSSQCSMLASLSAISVSECSQDLAGYSICVNKALDLPDDQGAASWIRPLVSHLQYLEVTHLDGSSSEQAIARREATMTIERLRTHLVRLRSLGATNCRVLSCASSPAT